MPVGAQAKLIIWLSMVNARPNAMVAAAGLEPALRFPRSRF
jgi:hypothetical protein